MKKILALMLTIAMALTLFTGCAGTTVVIGECTCPCVENDAAQPAPSDEEDAVIELPTEPAATEAAPSAPAEAVKTGLAIVLDVADTMSAETDVEGAAAYDITLAAVAIDDNGIIRDCMLDSVSASAAIRTDGTFSNDVTAPILTKNELGADYGMVAFGGAIAEWDQQAEALAQYAIGKTVEELKNGAVDETGRAPDGSDLQSGATIYLAGYVSAIEAAAANAAHMGAQAGDELVLASNTSLAKSTPADGETAGNAQLDCDVVMLTRKEGVITSCYIDALQAKIAFDSTGVITTDLSAPFLTKNQLGENYGMVAWGGAIAEWDAQAAAFADYAVGKTAAEVAGIAVNETTKPADGTDLASSVTIAIGGFQGLIAKAMQ